MPTRRAPDRSTGTPTRIAVVAFDGISPFHLAAPCLVFGEDRRELGVPAFELQVCAAEPGPLRTTAGFTISTGRGLRALRAAEVVIVPSWRDVSEPPPAALLAALRTAHGRGATIVGLCLGAFVLAAAGLLDGGRATTHWAWAPAFRERFPGVALDPSVLYVDAGRVVTSAGTAASLDCCLHLLRRWCGAEIANRVARRLVMAPHRRGGQAQFIERPLPETPRDTRLQDLLAWMQDHLDAPLGLDALAARVAMSRRNFTRQFQKVTGTTVLKWITHQRVARASRLLETTDRPVEAVAADAGFGSALSLRQHFAATHGVSPLAYRRQFRAAA
jgi:transcriptional regulator GlxA family with amidase domain